MNIITGISKFQVSGFKFQVKRFRLATCILISTIVIMSLGGCTSGQVAQEDEVSVKSDVKVASPILLPASEKVNFMAVTRYLQNNDIRTQINGVVRKINCSVASSISPDQALFIIQPQEAAALQKSKFGNSITQTLSDTIFSHISGQVKNLNVQVGDFVQAGDILTTCIRTNSMRIIVFIPVEKAAKIEKMKKCQITLPDGSKLSGHISGKLPSAESQDQTEAYIIEPSKPVSLAENINLNVQFTAEEILDALFVPESAVLGNEEQTSFWVMKLINDTTCIKVPIEKGLEQDSLIQVTGNKLTTVDKVVIEGGYGLADSARVQVINKK